MKKLIFINFCFLSLISTAQKKIKYETVFFEDKTIETPSMRINITGAVSESDVIKSKVKVSNFSDKTMVIKPEECFYTTPQGNLFSKDRWIIVAPRQHEAKVIDVKADNIKTDSTSIHINGIYVCNQLTIMNTAPTAVPPEKELKIGNFSLELDGFDRDGKEIMIKYKVKYVGDKIGIYTPSKVKLKSATGEFNNLKNKDDVFVFNKNEDMLIGFLFNSDSKKDNLLNWNDAFAESTPEKIESITIELKMDLIKTKDKN